jgi:hypothetical protein
LLRCCRFAAPYTAEPTQQLRVSEIHADLGWKCLRAAKAACCERNLGSTVFYASGLKAQQSIHRVDRHLSLVPPARPEWIVMGINIPLGLSMPSGRPREVTYPQADLICPHTVTVFIDCPSWGTDDLHTGDFHALRSAHVRPSNCDFEYRPEFVRRRTT